MDPTEIQRKVLNEWFNTARWIYNRCLAVVNEAKEKGLNYLHKKKLRELVINDDNYKDDPELYWVLRTPYDIKDGAMEDLLDAFHAAESKNTHISEKKDKAKKEVKFEIHFKTKRKMSDSIRIHAKHWKKKPIQHNHPSENYGRFNPDKFKDSVENELLSLGLNSHHCDKKKLRKEKLQKLYQMKREIADKGEEIFQLSNLPKLESILNLEESETGYVSEKTISRYIDNPQYNNWKKKLEDDPELKKRKAYLKSLKKKYEENKPEIGESDIQLLFREQVPDDLVYDTRLKRDNLGHFYLCVLNPIEIRSENQRPEPIMENEGNVLAIDPGTKTFLTGYDPSGRIIEWGRHDHLKIIKLGNRASRFQRLANKKNIGHRKRYQYLRSKQRVHQKIQHMVCELHCKLAKFLCENYDVILLPEFKSKQMAKKSYKRKLNNSCTFALLSWSHWKFQQRLIQKAREYPWCKVCIITEEYTTKTCGRCGHINDVKGDVFKCSQCKFVAERDSHAAQNIYLRFLTKFRDQNSKNSEPANVARPRPSSVTRDIIDLDDFDMVFQLYHLLRIVGFIEGERCFYFCTSICFNIFFR